jgi:hypothetical protein
MITCNSIQRYHGLDFTSYLALPQYSHSFLKSERSGFITPFAATDKMILGTLVDEILTGGSPNMNDKQYPQAKAFAYFINKEFGWALKKLEKQVSITANMRLDTGQAVFEMPVKFRPDFSLPKLFVLDLKVTSDKDVDNNIRFMKYGNQQFGYGKGNECDKGYILIYSKPRKEAFLRPVVIANNNSFWEEKLLKFGKVI